MLNQAGRRRRRSNVAPGSRTKHTSNSDRRKVLKSKLSPFPETKGLSLHSPYPLRELNRRGGGPLPELKMELSFADMEEGTSALSAPSCPRPHGSFQDRFHEDASSGLNLFCDLADEDRRSGFAGGRLMKPTNVLALERKVPLLKRGGIKFGGGGMSDGGGKSGDVKEVLKKSSTLAGSSGGEGWIGTIVAGEVSSDDELDEGVSHESDAYPSAHARGMWDNVVSWMKMAVDFISKDSTAEPVPEGQSSSSRSKKRALEDPDHTHVEPPTKRQPRPQTSASVQSQDGKMEGKAEGAARGQTLAASHSMEGLHSVDLKSAADSCDGPTSPVSTMVSVSSPSSVLAVKLSKRLSIASPDVLASASKSASTTLKKKKWKPPHMELLTSTTNLGLNSFLDKSFHPSPKKIRRQSLRTFYGNSVDSPNLTQVPVNIITVRRSPRNHASSAIPVPPPPPAIPALPPVPPPPPTPCGNSRRHNPAISDSLIFSPALPSSGGTDPSRDMLSQMQSRLRSRIKKKANGKSVGNSGSGMSATDGKSLDIKERQWAEIQSHQRKISLEDFLAQAVEKKKELSRVLNGLEESVPDTFKGIAEVIDIVQEGAQWFPGGNKDMKESMPAYKSLERKLETLTEYVHVCTEMNTVVSQGFPLTKAVHQQYVLYDVLHQLREEFDVRHRHWASVVSSNAESWTSIGLPVCHSLLRRSSDYMCKIVDRYVSACQQEATQLNETLLSTKCIRTCKLKDALKDCLSFLSKSSIYFCHDRTPECHSNHCQFCVSAPEDGGKSFQNSSNESANSSIDKTLPVSYDQSLLVSHTVNVLKAYAKVSLRQYERYVLHLSRQEVCEHFEGILKLISIEKMILCTVFSTKANSVRNSGGYSQFVSDPKELCQLLYTCCEKLVQHIVNKGSPLETSTVSPSKEEELTKEIVLWMMFGCKYIHQSLEFLGTEHAQRVGLVKLLHQLQHMENLL